MFRMILLAGASAIAFASSAVEATTFTFTGSAQNFIISQTGRYVVRAAGAQGGNNLSGGLAQGGLGARVVGTFDFTAGTALRIFVGGQGGSSAVSGGGGGGGAFVWSLSTGTLAVAGGGGGASYTGDGLPGVTTTSGSAGLGFPAADLFGGAGGTMGNGGSAGTNIQSLGPNYSAAVGVSGGGGGGLNSSGGYGGQYAGGGGSAFIFGLAGGFGGYYGASGGFGGGGGGGLGGGGGGGYSGGGAGSGNGGGGGGSFLVAGATDRVLESGVNNGNGYASITLAPTGAVPEPSSWAMLISGFGAIGAMLRRRRLRTA